MRPRRLANVYDVGVMCNVCPATVYRWLRNKTMPEPHKVGRHLVWSAAVIRRWIKKRNDLSRELGFTA